MIHYLMQQKVKRSQLLNFGKDSNNDNVQSVLSKFLSILNVCIWVILLVICFKPYCMNTYGGMHAVEIQH